MYRKNKAKVAKKIKPALERIKLRRLRLRLGQLCLCVLLICLGFASCHVLLRIRLSPRRAAGVIDIEGHQAVGGPGSMWAAIAKWACDYLHATAMQSTMYSCGGIQSASQLKQVEAATQVDLSTAEGDAFAITDIGNDCGDLLTNLHGTIATTTNATIGLQICTLA